MFKIFQKNTPPIEVEDFPQFYDLFTQSMIDPETGHPRRFNEDVKTNMILLAILQELKLLNSKK